MAENKLTDKHLRKLKPGKSEQVVGDGGGLWVRVMPLSDGGRISFSYRFEYAGKERRFNCGRYPDVSLAEARVRRNTARALVRSGVDPALKEAQDRTARAAGQVAAALEMTVEDLFKDWKLVYLSAHRKDGGIAVEQCMNRDVLPVIGALKAKDIRVRHIVQIIDRILSRNARRSANMALSLLRQMFRHGLARGLVEMDPTLTLSKKQAGGKESPGERNLSFAEIQELHTGIANSGLRANMQAAIWILLATGARVGELLKAKRSDVDLRQKIWNIPAENSKNRREHTIHLSAFSIRHLKTIIAEASGPFLFNGRAENTPLSDKAITKALRDRIRKTPLKNRTTKTETLLLSGGEWSPHDLRRTMASRMGDIDIAPHVIERCLNHIPQGIVGVYQRQEYLSERKAAFNAWGKKLSSLANAKKGSESKRGAG